MSESGEETGQSLGALKLENEQLNNGIQKLFDDIMKTLKSVDETRPAADDDDTDEGDESLASILSLYENPHLQKIFNRELIEQFHRVCNRYNVLTEDINRARTQHDEHLYRIRDNYAVVLNQLNRLMELRRVGSTHEVQRIKMQIQTIKSEQSAAQAKMTVAQEQEKAIREEMGPLQAELAELTGDMESLRDARAGGSGPGVLQAKLEEARRANAEARARLIEVQAERAGLIKRISAMKADKA